MNVMRTKLGLLIGVIAQIGSGCATVAPSEPGITIETVARGRPLEGAACTATIDVLRWDVTTPAVLAVGGAGGELRIVCDYPGFRTSELVFRPAVYSGSGLSAGVGFGTFGSGSGFSLGLGFPLGFSSARPAAQYPKRLVIEMNRP